MSNTVKLFVVQVLKDNTWEPIALYKGTVRAAMEYANETCKQVDEDAPIVRSRVKRVRTPAEVEDLNHLPVSGDGSLGTTEWQN